MSQKQSQSDLRTSERVEDQAKRLAAALAQGADAGGAETTAFPPEFAASGGGKGGGGGVGGSGETSGASVASIDS